MLLLSLIWAAPAAGQLANPAQMVPVAGEKNRIGTGRGPPDSRPVRSPSSERALLVRRGGDTTPVGERPLGTMSERAYDLTESLAEWTSSLYRPCPSARSDGREDQAAQGERVTRGGDYVFDTSLDELTGFFWAGFSRTPQHGHHHIGFAVSNKHEEIDPTTPPHNLNKTKTT